MQHTYMHEIEEPDNRWVSQKGDNLTLPVIRYTPAVMRACSVGEISADAANLLCYLVSLSRKNGFCRISNAELAWLFGRVSRQTAAKRLRSLVALGWVTSTIPKGESGSLRTLSPNMEKIMEIPPPLELPPMPVWTKGSIETDNGVW